MCPLQFNNRVALSFCNRPDSEVIAYIKQHTDAYAWTMEAETGFSRYLNQGVPYGPAGPGQRDRLTGYALDDNGGYRVPVTVEGMSYSPRFFPCGNAECLASGASIDFADANTLRWIKAADAKALSDIGWVLSVGAVIAPVGATAALSNTATVTSLLSGYLKSDTSSALSTATMGEGFQRYAVSRGLSVTQAVKLANALNVAGVWNTVYENSIRGME